MPKGIMGNGGLWYLLEALGVSATLFMPSLFLLANTVNLNQSTIHHLPFIPIAIVAYPCTLFCDNLCQSSCVKVADKRCLSGIDLENISAQAEAIFGGST